MTHSSKQSTEPQSHKCTAALIKMMSFSSIWLLLCFCFLATERIMPVYSGHLMDNIWVWKQNWWLLNALRCSLWTPSSAKSGLSDSLLLINPGQVAPFFMMFISSTMDYPSYVWTHIVYSRCQHCLVSIVDKLCFSQTMCICKERFLKFIIYRLWLTICLFGYFLYNLPFAVADCKMYANKL